MLVLLACAQPAAANNYGESVAWQFQTSADKANAALVQDMIQRKKNGMYAAPVYNYTTHIDHQYNCNVSATATGNQGTNSTVANSPSTTGNTANATGNDNDTDIHGSLGGAGGTNNVDGSQSNSGSVGSTVNGDIDTVVHGRAWQAINSEQTNSGNQTANVTGSNACAFGALN